jgi:hypothetical protein
MRSIRAGLVALFVAASFAVATPAARADHWQHHDGHWSYWHDGDKRWYYTDGSHWFFEEKGHWHLYKFDHGFGRKDFVMADYKPPVNEKKVVLPFHIVVKIK